MAASEIISKGIVGVSGSALGIITTFQTDLEWWVRIVGGLLGIAVAIVTLIKLLKPSKTQP